MTTDIKGNTETRIRDNKYFASMLRQRLKSRHGNGALREVLARMSDAELIETYLWNEQNGREYLAKLLTENRAKEL